MTIAGIVKSSLIDYPGYVSCVLFVPACNFDCFYCHNRQLIDGSYEMIGMDYVEEFLHKRAGLLDAVVISGGEPTLQKDLPQFIRSVKELGYKVKLDTNGSKPDVIKKLVCENACDYYAVDYKAPSGRYREIAGREADADKVLETVSILLGSGIDFEVRTTVIPQLGIPDLITMAKELPVVPRYVLNQYRMPVKFKPEDWERLNLKPYTREQIKQFAEIIRAEQPNVM